MRALPLLFGLALVLSACGGRDAAPSSDDTVILETPPSDSAAVAPDGGEVAVARIEPLGDSQVAGTVEFRALDGAVEVRYDLTGLGAGEHGFHVHENGSCAAGDDGTPGGAAGGHFNPMASPHGAPSNAPSGRHAGDLGNITAGPDGHAQGVVVDSVLAFTGPTSMIGKAFVIHAGRDDLTSQPSGDAGARVGCGVIDRASPADAAMETVPDSVVGSTE